VSRVRVISTGSGAIHPEHMYGTRKPAYWWVLTSKQWVSIPINVFVIEHADGIVLFDAGLDPRVVSDPEYWRSRITRGFMNRIFRFDISPEQCLGSQLRAAGCEPGDVTTAIFSHLHFDHVGGISDIPEAELLVHEAAWDHLLGSDPEREAVPRREILRPGARWRSFGFEATSDPRLAPFTESYDVMGDGSLIALPTPGHIPGSASLLVRRTGAPPVLLIGDLTYSEELLDRDQVAGTGNKGQLLASYAKVRELRERTPGLLIVASHDATAAARLAAAPSDRAAPAAEHRT
jgi:glyoxylase-like metal-dependent hydrolase (beta-lactamase superfamily II)